MENKKRIIDIDGLRGLSCFLMLIYHFEAIRVFMLGSRSLFLGTWFDSLLGNYVRVSFLILVGVSFGLSFHNSKKKFNYNRLIKIFGLAALITLLSYIFAPDYVVVLGIIHLILISSLLLSFIGTFKNPKYVTLGFILLVLFLYYLKLDGFNTNVYWLDILFGFYTSGFSSLDYFPVVPWLIWPLLGFVVSDGFVRALEKFSFSLLKNKYLVSIGKNALYFYIGHLVMLCIFWFTISYFL